MRLRYALASFLKIAARTARVPVDLSTSAFLHAAFLEIGTPMCRSFGVDRRGHELPHRLRKIKKRAKAFGLELEEPTRGAHWKLRRGSERPYTITAHSGLNSMISDEYVLGLCRHFEIDREGFLSGI